MRAQNVNPDRLGPVSYLTPAPSLLTITLAEDPPRQPAASTPLAFPPACRTAEDRHHDPPSCPALGPRRSLTPAGSGRRATNSTATEGCAAHVGPQVADRLSAAVRPARATRRAANQRP